MPSAGRKRDRVSCSFHFVRSTALRFVAGLGLLLSLSSSVPTSAQEQIPLAWRALGGPPGPVSQVAISQNGADIYAVTMAATRRRDDETQWSTAAPLQQERCYLP